MWNYFGNVPATQYISLFLLNVLINTTIFSDFIFLKLFLSLLWLQLCTHTKKCSVISVHGPAKQAINYVLFLVYRYREFGWAGAENHPFSIRYQLPFCFIYFISISASLQHDRPTEWSHYEISNHSSKYKDIGIKKVVFVFIQQILSTAV